MIKEAPESLLSSKNARIKGFADLNRFIRARPSIDHQFRSM